MVLFIKFILLFSFSQNGFFINILYLTLVSLLSFKSNKEAFYFFVAFPSNFFKDFRERKKSKTCMGRRQALSKMDWIVNSKLFLNYFLNFLMDHLRFQKISGLKFFKLLKIESSRVKKKSIHSIFQGDFEIM